jgi:hypothetical protein
MSIKKKSLAILCIITFASTIGLVLGATYYTQTITWTKGTATITATNSDTTALGVLDLTTPHTETRTYTITNTGTLSGTVYPHTSGTGFSASWNKPSAVVAAGGTTTFILSLTITDAGSCTVTFTDTA